MHNSTPNNLENQAPNSNADQWADMDVKKTSETSEYPMIGDEVPGGYKIASMPFDDKSEAYDFMREYQYDNGYTTYYDAPSGYWFIVTK